ncbi:hypothetical protein G9A89_004949 [Geosiphon pyriformis]|nr:hypothetical protein G9A89_004949 [Geosiphon pyriformis]
MNIQKYQQLKHYIDTQQFKEKLSQSECNIYERTATLPVERKINTYPAEPITEENFQETLLRRTYDLIETLENKQRRAADNIQKSQKKQIKRHDSQLLDKLVEFKIENKVLLYCTKVEKQWNGKFDLK